MDNIYLYMSAIEHKPFNSVAPPFSHETLTFAVHLAAMDARERRECRARVGSAQVGWAHATT